jgi:hypothetical protein
MVSPCPRWLQNQQWQEETYRNNAWEDRDDGILANRSCKGWGAVHVRGSPSPAPDDADDVSRAHSYRQFTVFDRP